MLYKLIYKIKSVIIKPMTTKIEIYEKYLLAEDKEAYLDSIKTSSEYQVLIIHYCLNNNIPLPEQFKHQTVINQGESRYTLKNLL